MATAADALRISYDAYVQKVNSKSERKSMVETLLDIMSDAVDTSGVADGNAFKRQKVIESIKKSKTGLGNSARARFALGGDDGAYLRSNVMPLETVLTDDNERIAVKITDEARTASYLGMLSALSSSEHEKLQGMSERLMAVWQVACWAISIAEVCKFVKHHIQTTSTAADCKQARMLELCDLMQSGGQLPSIHDKSTWGVLRSILPVLLVPLHQSLQAAIDTHLETPRATVRNIKRNIKELLTNASALQTPVYRDNAFTGKYITYKTSWVSTVAGQEDDRITLATKCALNNLFHMDQKNEEDHVDYATVHAFLRLDKLQDSPTFQSISRNAFTDERTHMLCFAMARGLCGRRAAHHRPSTLPRDDDGLLYNTPTTACPTMSQIVSIRCGHSPLDRPIDYAAFAVTTGDEDFCNFENQGVSVKTKWTPIKSVDDLSLDDSSAADLLAKCSVMEHLVRYYNKKAAAAAAASDVSKNLAHAAAAKLAQAPCLASLYSIDGNRLRNLCPPAGFRTVPVSSVPPTVPAAQCGSVRYAFGAGCLRFPQTQQPAYSLRFLYMFYHTHSPCTSIRVLPHFVGKCVVHTSRVVRLRRKEEEGKGNAPRDSTISRDRPKSFRETQSDVISNELQQYGRCMFISAPLKYKDIAETVNKANAGPLRFPESLPTLEEHIDALKPDRLYTLISGCFAVCESIIEIQCEISAIERESKAISERGVSGMDELLSIRSGRVKGRREEVWNDAMREAAISGDRLYAFVRQLSGTIHEQVDSVCVVDESVLVQQQKDNQANARRLSLLASQKHVQLVSDVFKNILSESGLVLGIDDHTGINGDLKVVSNTLRKQVSQLASGNGTEGFFANSVRLENLMAQGTGEMTLSALFKRLRDVGVDLQQAAVEDSQDGLVNDTPSLEYLSSPRNSLLLRYKPEAHAAIRQAYDTFNREMQTRHHSRGYYLHRKISAFELIEGRHDELCMAFAAFAAHTLAHQRMFSASHAAYLGQFASRANIAAMRFTLDKLIGVACRYLADTERPDFTSDDGWKRYFGAER